jgi:membrane-associated protease RseP (regulator of RpoE activity)
MKRICCVRRTTMRGLLLFAAAAMLVGLARGQATQSTRENPGSATSTQTPATSQPGQPAAQPSAQPTFQQSGQSATQQAGQQAGRQPANQNGSIGVKFDNAARGEKGLRVESVDPNSPAAEAGIQANDQIISADGRPFKRSRHLDTYLSAQAGRPVPLVIERNGRQSMVEVMPMPIQGDHGWLGVLLEEHDQTASNPPAGQNAQKGQNAPNAQNGANRKGAEVAQVAPDGPAARAGLRPGDVIVQVNGKEIDDPAELVADIHEMKPQTKAEFTVVRDNQEQKIPVTVGNRSEEYAEGQPGEGQGQFGPGQFGAPFPGQFPPRQFPQGPNGQFAGGQQFGNPNAAQQFPQQLMEQNQRIEQELRQLRDEVKQLREQLQKK